MNFRIAPGTSPLDLYDATHDSHLRSYFSRPEVRKTVTRAHLASILAAESHDPWYLALHRLSSGGFQALKAAPADAALFKQVCGCTDGKSCAFCVSPLAREALMAKSEVRAVVHEAVELGHDRRRQSPPQVATPRTSRPRRPASAPAPPKSAPSASTADKPNYKNFRITDARPAAVEAAPPIATARVRSGKRPIVAPKPPATTEQGVPLKEKPKRARRHITSTAAENHAVSAETAVVEDIVAAPAETASSQHVTPTAKIEAVQDDAHEQDLHSILSISGHMTRCCIIIQARWRGFVARSQLDRRRVAAVMIQHVYRQHLAACRAMHAARTVQKVGRGMFMRRRIYFYKKRSELASHAFGSKSRMRKEITDFTSRWGDVFKSRLAIVVDQSNAFLQLVSLADAKMNAVFLDEIQQRESTARITLVKEVERAFEAVLRRKQLIQSISNELVNLERNEKLKRRDFEIECDVSYLSISAAAQRYGLSVVQEFNARQQQRWCEVTDFISLSQAAGGVFAEALHYQWLRESEARLRHFIVTCEHIETVTLAKEYSRLRLCFSESEKRRLVRAVEESERFALLKKIALPKLATSQRPTVDPFEKSNRLLV